MPVKQDAETRKKTTATLSALQPKQHLSDEVYDKIAAIHNSSVGHWGQAKCIAKLNDPSVTDRMIYTFIRQCPCCQVMSRLKVQIKTHLFTCASYNPFEVIHLDHIGPLNRRSWQHVHPWWVELFPHQDNDGIGLGTPEVVHTDRGTAFHNKLVSELLRMSVERGNQEVLRHQNAILFDSQVHNKWSFEQLLMV